MGLWLFNEIDISVTVALKMEISQKAKDELKQIYLIQTGKPLSELEAERMAQDLFHLFDVIYRPLPKSKKSNNSSI